MADEENKEPQKEEKAPEAPAHYHAVVLRADGELGVESFDTIEALVERLKALIDHDVTAYSFAGARLNISKPPFRHLLTPWGNLQLFDIPKENLEPDDTGYLGLDPIHLEAPPEIKAPGPQKSSVNTSDFFSDEDDNSLNVFDNILPDPDS
jgi:hypothetical protein